MSRADVDRSPMFGESGRVYRVLGEDDVPAFRLQEPGPDLVFCVYSPANYPPKWTEPGRYILVCWIAFDDVDEDTRWSRCISEEQAARVAIYLRARKPISMVFQCEAGKSRSAALCAAVARSFGDDAVFEECHRRYEPNPLVLERVEKALAGGSSPRREERKVRPARVLSYDGATYVSWGVDRYHHATHGGTPECRERLCAEIQADPGRWLNVKVENGHILILWPWHEGQRRARQAGRSG